MTTPAAMRNFDEGTDPSKLGSGDPRLPKSRIGPSNIAVKPGESIQEAIDETFGRGGGVVHLEAGTYVLTTDLILKSNVTLNGAGNFSTILDFGGEAYSLKIEGEDAYETGTVAVTADSTTVIGTGTTFTDSMVGQSILIDGDFYTIASRTSNTEIEIATAFSGATQSGLSFVVATINIGATVQNCTIQNSSQSVVLSRYSYLPSFFNVAVYTGDIGMDFQDCVFPVIDNLEISDCTTAGLSLDNAWAYTISSFFIYNCTGDGILSLSGGDATMFNFGLSNNGGRGAKLTNTDKLSVIAFTIDSNTSHGIECVSGCDGNTFVTGTVIENGGDGIKLTATDDRNIISELEVSNNVGYGVNIAASTCDDNIVVAATFTGNTSGEVNDSGTNSIISGNKGVTDSNINWNPFYQTLTYASASTFTISGNHTSTFQTGTKIKLTQTTVKYWYVKSSSHSLGTTTVTIVLNTNYTLANAAITSPYFSRADNPEGFPTFFDFDCDVTGFSSATETFLYSMNGAGMTILFDIQGTSNATTKTATLPVAPTQSMRYIHFRIDNGTSSFGRLDVADGSTTADFFSSVDGGAWTNSGTCHLRGVVSYFV